MIIFIVEKESITLGIRILAVNTRLERENPKNFVENFMTGALLSTGIQNIRESIIVERLPKMQDKESQA